MRYREIIAESIDHIVQQVHDAYVQRYGAKLWGHCEEAAGDLAEVLTQQGYSADVVSGTYAKPFRWPEGDTSPITGHTWVEVDDLILDPTCGQINSKMIVRKGTPVAQLYREEYRHREALEEARNMRGAAAHRLYHASPATIDRFVPFSHFGTEAAARARAGNSKYQGQRMKLYTVDLVARNPIRVRDFKMAPAVHNWSSLVDALHYTVRKITAEERYRIHAAAAPREQNAAGGQEALVEVLHEHGWDAIVYRNRFEDAGQDSWINLTSEQVRIIEVTELGSKLSEAKITAYHGTGNRISSFSDGSLAGHFFTQDKEYAKLYVGAKTPIATIDKPKKGRNYLLTVELDINHPLDTKHDPASVAFYNDEFLPNINALNAKYSKPPLPPISIGKYVSFVDADWLYRYIKRYGSPYDAILVDEGITDRTDQPAIVPLSAAQIRILKREILR